MKLSKMATEFKWRIFFIFVLGNLFIQRGTSAILDSSNLFEGTWGGALLNIEPTTSITASINSSILSIQSTVPIYDITINILNNQGEVVLQKQVVAENSAYIVLSINHLPAGDYQLELSNSFGGYLSGFFYKN